MCSCITCVEAGGHLVGIPPQALSISCTYVCTCITCVEAGGYLAGIPPQALSISWFFVLRQSLSLFLGSPDQPCALNSLCVLRQGLSLPYLVWLASEPSDPPGFTSMCHCALVFIWVLRVELRSSHCMASIQTEPYPQASHCLFVSLEHHEAPSGGARMSLQLGHRGPGKEKLLVQVITQIKWHQPSSPPTQPAGRAVFITSKPDCP